MPTELAAQDQPLDAKTMELVIADGDLKTLNATQRIAWYKARCDAAGLDPRTQPFEYLELKGKLKLYATKAATDQLIANRKLTVAITDRRHDQHLGVYEVQCRVTFPDGHWVEDFAAVPTKGKLGDDLCNALMKTCTKAKRRTVLSACGLGILDETEVETITVDPPRPQAIEASGETSGRHPEADVIRGFDSFLDAMCEKANAGWIESITSKKTGELLSADAEIISRWKLREHLHKWARSLGWIRFDVPLDQKHMVTAMVWHEQQADFTEEAQRYCRQLWKAAFKAAKDKRSGSAKRESPEVLELREQDEGLDEMLTTTEAGSRG